MANYVYSSQKIIFSRHKISKNADFLSFFTIRPNTVIHKKPLRFIAIVFNVLIRLLEMFTAPRGGLQRLRLE